MKRNTFLTLFTIFTISSLAMLDQGHAQTETRLQPTGNLFPKMGDIKGEVMSAPWLGGISVGTPADKWINTGDDDQVLGCSDDPTAVLFAGFNLMPAMPHGGVLSGIAEACNQLGWQVMSDEQFMFKLESAYLLRGEGPLTLLEKFDGIDGE